jgi:hypothetical protein
MSTRLPAHAAAAEQRLGQEREPTAPTPTGEASEAFAASEARRLDFYERSTRTMPGAAS